MSQLPPCSRGGTVRAASLATRSNAAPLRVPRTAFLAFGQVGQGRHALGIRGDQLGLALVPLGQEFVRRSAADQARMGQAGKPHARDVPRRGVDAVQVPDGLGRVGIMVGEETAAVVAGEDAGEAPLVAPQAADIEDVDDENVAGLGPFDLDRAAQDVDDRQVDVADVVRAVVVLDLAVGPVLAFDPERRRPD